MEKRKQGAGSILVWALWAAVSCMAGASSAAAQQVVLLDQVVNPKRGLPVMELNKSEYSVYAKDFASPSPASLRSPVNYAEGNIHVRLEVLSKPSNVETLFTLCLHDGTNLTCIRYLPKYTAPGVYEYDQPLLGQYNYAVYDFGKPVTRIILAIKDAMEGLLDPADPRYDSFFPTSYRITMALVAKGGTYVPPAMTPRDAGIEPPSPDAGAPAQLDAAAGSGTATGVVIVDERLTATAQSASQSRIVFPLTSQTPTSLRSPIDYAAGSLHARVEVFSRPGGAPTKLRACLESMSDKTVCTDYLAGQSYLGVGALDHEQTLASLQNAASYDWTAQLRRAYLQVSDTFGNGVAGADGFFPTDLRLTMTLLPQGVTYTPPWLVVPEQAGPANEGARPDSGGPLSDSGSGDDAGATGSPATGLPAGVLAAGDGEGCSLSRSARAPGGDVSLLALIALGLLSRRRRALYVSSENGVKLVAVS